MTSDDTAYLIYLLLFLAFIGGYHLFSRRGQLGATLQQAVIWILIFLGVVIAYGFKDTLQATLFPARGQENGNEIVFRKSNDAQFHAVLEVNGQDVKFLIDTGASNLVLSQRDAKSVGIDTDALAYLDRAQTANGVANFARVTLDWVKLGQISDRDVPASISEGGLNTSLLGMSYLARFGEIRITGDTLTIIR